MNKKVSAFSLAAAALLLGACNLASESEESTTNEGGALLTSPTGEILDRYEAGVILDEAQRNLQYLIGVETMATEIVDTTSLYTGGLAVEATDAEATGYVAIQRYEDNVFEVVEEAQYESRINSVYSYGYSTTTTYFLEEFTETVEGEDEYGYYEDTIDYWQIAYREIEDGEESYGRYGDEYEDYLSGYYGLYAYGESLMLSYSGSYSSYYFNASNLYNRNYYGFVLTSNALYFTYNSYSTGTMTNPYYPGDSTKSVPTVTVTEYQFRYDFDSYYGYVLAAVDYVYESRIAVDFEGNILENAIVIDSLTQNSVFYYGEPTVHQEWANGTLVYDDSQNSSYSIRYALYADIYGYGDYSYLHTESALSDYTAAYRKIMDPSYTGRAFYASITTSYETELFLTTVIDGEEQGEVSRWRNEYITVYDRFGKVTLSEGRTYSEVYLDAGSYTFWVLADEEAEITSLIITTVA